ncbi:PLP-dependent aminotransferase family protein [Streptomyces spiralis]|uniref:aminotransferase-like domain-containing protein n=1 Tax=Streptomyces spiralis TaxID=66376 RepID=UPI0036AC04FE
MTDDVWNRMASERWKDNSEGLMSHRLASVLRGAITSGELLPGQRLQPIAALAKRLEVSPPTVQRIYKTLAHEGLVGAQANRHGTFVLQSTAGTAPAPDFPAHRRLRLAQLENTLRAAYSDAVDLMRGSPPPDSLPLPELKRAWMKAAPDTADLLGYPQFLDAEPQLVDAVLPLLRVDGVPCQARDLLVISSTQQALTLMCEILRSREAPGQDMIVGVEEPGYQTAMDTLERHGMTLAGMAMDEHGVQPASLKSALDAGAWLVVFTPRAQSPTGVSWVPERREELADVLAHYPNVWILEDDHFAEAASTRPGSLIADPRLADRVLYVRSFSKTLAADLRVAVGVARSPLRDSLLTAKSFNDGWSSRLMQRVVAALLAEPGTAATLQQARETYATRRRAFCAALADGFERIGVPLNDLACGPDGLHVWVPMPPGQNASTVVEAVARRGFLFAPSEPFHVTAGPGTNRFVRVNAGAADLDTLRAAAHALTAALGDFSSQRLTLTP